MRDKIRQEIECFCPLDELECQTIRDVLAWVDSRFSAPNMNRFSHSYELQSTDRAVLGMDGYALARAIRASENISKVSLIALSGYSQRNESRDSGFDRYLLKPLDFDELRHVLAVLIS